MNCRHCGEDLSLVLLDLGSSPPSNSYLKLDSLVSAEKWYPLRVMVCQKCWLVQTEDYVAETEMFSNEYAYFSSFSTTFLQHARGYTESMIERFELTSDSTVVEIASNDGYLLQYFLSKNIKCLGIEPTASTAAVARGKGIDVIQEFFGSSLARRLVSEGCSADLMVANNVLAHVPDINDFVSGFTLMLNPGGVATFEFPHLVNLIEHNQFDTIYHEHYSYLSLTAVKQIFESVGLSLFDVEVISTHGGSLRVYAERSEDPIRSTSTAIQNLLAREKDLGVTTDQYYSKIRNTAFETKLSMLKFIYDSKKAGLRISAYGAAAKGNTLLNYVGLKSDTIDYVVDKNVNKQGLFLPGSRIPIVGTEMLKQEPPDVLIILPWNISEEISKELIQMGVGNCKAVTFIPEMNIQDLG